MRVPSPVLSLLLTPCLALNPLWAQLNSAVPAQPGPQSPLQLHVVDDPGRAVANSISAKGYVLQVSDSSGNPVSSAAVALRLPEDNPTGRFTNGLRAWVAYTNAAGIATFPAIRWQEITGAVELRATAAKASMHAGLLIQQQIQPGQPALAVIAPAAPAPAPALKPTVPAAASAPILKAATPATAPLLRPAPPQTPKIALSTPGQQAASAPLADIVPSISKSGAAPLKQSLTPNPPLAANPEKTVSIVNLKTGAGGSGHSNKKWLIIGAIGTGAAVGALLALKGHGAGGGSTASNTGLSIGTPTISVGH